MMIDSARYPRLALIQTPDDLRTFDESELRAVADELRAYLIESVGKSGGHFAAGLGVIELTVALHYLYQTPVDQLVWDVGHQTYPHKILTGRRDEIHTVKQKDGVAPFPCASRGAIGGGVECRYLHIFDVTPPRGQYNASGVCLSPSAYDVPSCTALSNLTLIDSDGVGGPDTPEHEYWGCAPWTDPL